jgi:hypothetical protein
MISEVMKKVCSSGSFLGKKIQNAVLRKKKLDEIEARLEHSPRKSPTQ